MITESQRAAHAVRIVAPKLADEAVAEQYRMQPDLRDRYGPDGYRHCVRDVGHHVNFLAASVDAGDPRRFVEYVAYAKGLLAAHGILPGDFHVSLRALRRVVTLRLAADVANVVLRHIDAGLAAVQIEATDVESQTPENGQERTRRGSGS